MPIPNPWFKISDTCYVDLTQIALVRDVDYMTIRITFKNGSLETIRAPKSAAATIKRMNRAMKKLYEPNLPSIKVKGCDVKREEKDHADPC